MASQLCKLWSPMRGKKMVCKLLSTEFPCFTLLMCPQCFCRGPVFPWLLPSSSYLMQSNWKIFHYILHTWLYCVSVIWRPRGQVTEKKQKETCPCVVLGKKKVFYFWLNLFWKIYLECMYNTNAETGSSLDHTCWFSSKEFCAEIYVKILVDEITAEYTVKCSVVA